MTSRPAAFAAFLVLSLAGCAGATFQSGVGDRFFDRPPYYAGSARGADAPVAHLPVGWQRGAAQAPLFEPDGGPGSEVAKLLAEMNAELATLGVGARLDGGALAGRGPDVWFSCETDAAGDCLRQEADPSTSEDDQLKLAIHRPAREWTASLQPLLDGARAERVLMITLEVGQRFVRQRNLLGSKEVLLGTGYAVRLPWLTSLDTPVSVLQLTGAVLDREGKAIRIGAEGLLAQRTSLLVSSIGGQALVREEEVARLRTLRREDLRGQPLAWQVALRHLVGQLLERE